MQTASAFLVGALLVGCGANLVTPPRLHSDDSSTVHLDDSSTAHLDDSSTAHLVDSSTAHLVDSSTAHLVDSSTAHLVDSSGEQAEATPEKQPAQQKKKPLRYTVRKTIPPVAQPTIPRVLLSAEHEKLCRVKVGDPFPALALPRFGLPRLEAPTTELATLRGQQATVVLYWHPDRWMARTALIDMQRDIASQFDAKQVAVVGIAVSQPTGSVQAALNQAQATFPQLLDTDGKAFATVGTVALPRLYVLDPEGKIVWFDIEYSEGTRRELWQTLRLLARRAL